MRKWKIFLILSVLLLTPLIAVHIIYPLYQVVIQHQPVPYYQKPTEEINPTAICKKIHDQTLREMCFSKIEHPDLQLPLSVLEKIGEESEDILLCGSIPLSVFLTKTRKDTAFSDLKSLIAYSRIQESESTFSEYVLCYQALVENPYYCRRLGSFYEVLGPDKCYTDAASTWGDSSLCRKIKDKDRCYFRLALKIVRNDL